MVCDFDLTQFFVAVGLCYSLHLIVDSLVYILMKIHCHGIMKSGTYHICKYWSCNNYYKCPYNMNNRSKEDLDEFKRSK